MGGGKWTDDDWGKYSSSGASSRLRADGSAKSTAEIFKSRSMDPALNPMGVDMRESRDSADNPNSNAIIIGLDVTGSMGSLADKLAREGLPVLVKEIYDRKPVADPHIMCMAIGDVECDRAPLQCTQFEADIRIAEQLDKLFLEGGGGGNSYESYTFPWYFAAMHTSIDCFEKRGKKGYLFTMGDEEPTKILRASSIKQFLGSGPQQDLTAEELLTMVSRKYNVFHLMVEQGSHMRGGGDHVKKLWTDLLGQRAIPLSDYTKMSEVIVSTIQIMEGADRAAVVDSWNGDTSLVVAHATRDLVASGAKAGAIVTL